MNKHTLTKDEKVNILIEYTSLGKKPYWTEISKRTGINHQTIGSFINTYNESHELNRKR